MTYLKRLYNVLGWTLLGAASAFTFTALILQVQFLVMLSVNGVPVDAWYKNAWLYGIATGLLVGLLHQVPLQLRKEKEDSLAD